jgi:hypothetical protein
VYLWVAHFFMFVVEVPKVAGLAIVLFRSGAGLAALVTRAALVFGRNVVFAGESLGIAQAKTGSTS